MQDFIKSIFRPFDFLWEFLRQILRTKKLIFYILCFSAFFSIRIASGQSPCVGDVVKIENLGPTGAGSGTFLTDNGTSALLASGNVEWVIKRGGAADGTVVTSGMFPKLMNLATGKYLTGSGSPIPMGTTDYGSGEFWTPVDLDPSTNIPNSVDTILNAFGNPSVGYPNQYTYVLYSGLSGQGNTPTGQPAPPSTIPAIPIIKTPVYYDRKVAFVSNGGVILSFASGSVTTAGTISNNNTNMWYIRKVRTYIQQAFSQDLATANTDPVALNTLINTAKYSSVASTLIDIPSQKSSIYSKIAAMVLGIFMTFNPMTGSAPTSISSTILTTLQNMQVFLSNSNLSNYLSSSVPSGQTVAEKVFAQNFLYFVSFIIDLQKATTPSAVTAIINNSNYLNYPSGLVDTPNIYISIFTKIQSFFISNKPSVSGQSLIDLQALLSNTNLNKFLNTTPGVGQTVSEQTTVTGTLLPAVNSANNQTAFATALAASTTPAALNTNIVSNTNFNQTYLANYPSATNSIYTAIQGFFNNRTAATLPDLNNLLTAAVGKNFLSTTAATGYTPQQTMVADWKNIVFLETKLLGDVTALNNKATANPPTVAVSDVTTFLTNDRPNAQNLRQAKATLPAQ